MKKLFVGLVLPILAAAAIIGSGFSVWAFTDTGALPNKEDNAPTVLENVRDDGSFTITPIGGIGFSLDQKTVPTGVTNTDANGAHFTFTNNKTTATFAKNQNAEANVEIPKSINVVITVPNAVDTYVNLLGSTIAGGTDLGNGQGREYTYLWEIPDTFATNPTTQTWDMSKVVSAEYKPNQEPQNITEYKAIDTKFKTTGIDKTIRIEYELVY